MAILPLNTKGERSCKYCGIFKPQEEFRSPGRHQCKDCHRADVRHYNKQHRKELAEYQRLWNFRNRERINKRARLYRRNNIESFKQRERRHHRKFRNRRREYKKRWALDNPEKYRAMVRSRRARRKARERGADGCFTMMDVVAIHENQKGLCFYCGVDLVNDYHVDHFVPLSMGGSNNPSNLRLSCPGCNALKGVRNPHEFIQSEFLRLF